ncbi:uncharacterized protein LOC135544339 [Oncorhynchus masou masou]|uniref:uncharacterized protein LOC135544339 n=1 Tax=Oncorhynchus masou masou TaxID=90313 RepID=UPI003182F527
MQTRVRKEQTAYPVYHTTTLLQRIQSTTRDILQRTRFGNTAFHLPPTYRSAAQKGLGRMSLPRNRTLENGITQLQYINNGEPLSSLQFHLQNTGSVTSVPGSPTGGVRGGGATPVLSSGQRGGGYGRPSGAERFSGLLGVLSTGDGSEPDHRAGQQYTGATQWHVLYCSDLLDDGGCVALLVVGFILVTSLLVLALAAYCRLARHL